MNDYEQLVIDVLAPVLAPVPVATRPVDQVPSLRVRRVGGYDTSRVRSAVVLTLEGYGTTESEAQGVTERAYAWLTERSSNPRAGSPIRGVESMSGPVLLPDPDRPKDIRYSATVQIISRRKQVH